MKATELRIGNYVRVINGSFVGFVANAISIKYNFSTYIYEINDEPISYFEPIPLTEEWLLKFGFEKCKVFGMYPDSFLMKDVLKSDLYLRPSYQGGYYWGFITKSSITKKEEDHEFYEAMPIQFVHQLQNLYFALTGEELEIIKKP